MIDKVVSDYHIPVIILSLLLISETELEKHGLNMCCQFCITITAVILFYVLVLSFKCSKNTAGCIAIMFCILAVYFKNSYVIRIV
jgi:hypothetical protein